MGTIQKPIIRYMNHYDSITEIAKQNDSNLKTVVLKKEIMETNRYLSKYLEVALATKIFHLIRLRILDGVEATIERSWIPYPYVKGIENLDFEQISLYQTIEELYGIKMKERNEELRIVRANEIERDVLHVPLESDVLLLKGCVKDQNERVFEYFENTALPDLYVFKG